MNVSEPLLRDRETPFGSVAGGVGHGRKAGARRVGPRPDYRKGTRLIFRGREVDARQRKRARRRRRRSREELSFLVNSGARQPCQTPESVYPEMGWKRWESTRAFRVSGAPPTVRENSSTGAWGPPHASTAPPGVLITASGLQGAQPLVHRRM